MSQHIFRTQHEGKPVEVLMGWDRPLQGFFMVIEKVDEPDDEYLYSNLDDRSLTQWMGLPPRLDPFLYKLETLGISGPAKMLLEVRADALADVGDLLVTYNADGSNHVIRPSDS